MAGNINWYPGHMKKTRELIQENLKMVDAVVEVIDARIPVSSRNPIIDELVKGKPRIIALNKSDLGDGEANRAWIDAFAKAEDTVRAIPMNSMTGEGTKELLRVLETLDSRRRGNAAMKPYRLMIVGVPNVGKSSLINRMTGHKSAKTGDRPGVTRGKQWLKLENGMQLLDTPGILWPKFEDQEVGKRLAYIGSIKDEILNLEELSLELLDFLRNNYPGILNQRFGISEEGTPLSMLEGIADARKCLIRGSEWDYAKASGILMDEFRSGKLGRITLEYPEVLVKNDEDNQ